MRPISKTVSAVASSEPIPLDHYISPANITVDVRVNGTSVTFAGEYTTDDIYAAGYDPNDPSSNWSTITGVSGAASVTGNIAFPVTAVRLDVTAIASGSVTMTVIQSGGPE